MAVSSIYANRGKNLEELIKAANLRYAEIGVAVIDKQHTLWLPIRNNTGKIVSAKVEEKATVDFRGTVKNFGGVSFDVKETSSERWYLRELQPHQRQHLERCSEVGDTCFVLISFWKKDRFAALMLSEYLSLVQQEVKSVKFDQIETAPIGRIWDYLTEVIRKGENIYDRLQNSQGEQTRSRAVSKTDVHQNIRVRNKKGA